jgi:hypothetical protein
MTKFKKKLTKMTQKMSTNLEVSPPNPATQNYVNVII